MVRPKEHSMSTTIRARIEAHHTPRSPITFVDRDGVRKEHRDEL